MGYSSSSGSDGWGTCFGRSQTTPLTTAIIYPHQQVAKGTNTQLVPPAPFGFLKAECHKKEQGQGTNIHMQQGETALLCMSWFLAKCQSDKGSLGSDSALASGNPKKHSGNPKKLKWELRKKITDKQSTEDMTVP